MTALSAGVAEPGSSEQTVRAAKKFALAAAAGELATACGVTPWRSGDAERAATLAFHRWLDKRGGAGSHEERQAVEQVRLIIEQHEYRGSARRRFYCPRSATALAGAKEKGRSGNMPPEIWKPCSATALTSTFVAQTLARAGCSADRTGGTFQCVVALGGKSKNFVRMF